MGIFTQTPYASNMSFVDSPDPLTRNSNFLHTLPVFVGKRGLTCVQNVPLRSAHTSHRLFLRVCNLMHLPLIQLPLHAKGARRSPLIYPANRIHWDRWPRCIWCYQMSFNDDGLWCWDATSLLLAGDPPSLRWGRRGLLSLFFQVHAHQGTVTVPRKSLSGVCVPKTSSPLRSIRPEHCMLLLYNLISISSST